MIVAWFAMALAGSGFKGGPLYQGMSYSIFARNASSMTRWDESLAMMPKDGINAVALNTGQFQANLQATTIGPRDGVYNDAPLIHAIQQIHKLGMKVLLKPMVNSMDRHWRGEIPASDAWFQSYFGFIRHYAQIAADQRCEAFSVGCEFNANQSDEANWRKAVAAVRAIYKGPITYACNWDSYQKVKWWDAVDFIGIDAYFPLTKGPDPSLSDLLASWNGWAKVVGDWRAKNYRRKKIVFTEIGYRSIKGANVQPWEFAASSEPDEQEQANCYEAVLRTMADKRWWNGAFWWDWSPNPNGGGPKDQGYTPQGKMAEATLRRYYLGK